MKKRCRLIISISYIQILEYCVSTIWKKKLKPHISKAKLQTAKIWAQRILDGLVFPWYPIVMQRLCRCSICHSCISVLNNVTTNIIPYVTCVFKLSLKPAQSRRSILSSSHSHRDEARYNFTHEILKDEESVFNGKKVPRLRRISVICRNLPSWHPLHLGQDLRAQLNQFYTLKVVRGTAACVEKSWKMAPA